VAHFSALPAGRYTFQVVAINMAQDAASPILSIDFAILPPWWNTLWFRTLCVAASILLMFLLYRLRVGHLVRQGRELEALVLARTRALEANEEKLRIQATHDGLTGLLNRDAVLARLDAERQRAVREQTALAIVLVDIDHFKRINDTHGHLAGDEALRRFARVLEAQIRPYDHAGRYGGEEFILVLTGVSGADLDARLAALHGQLTNLRVPYGDVEFFITCSMGAVYLSPHTNDVHLHAILERADKALYEAKGSGRNRLVGVSM
jgi:diguanylate cyclase (GGDEF)-like protein